MDTISSPADYLIRECPREDCRAVVYIPTRRLDDRCGWCQNCDWSRYRVEADHCRLDRSCSEANNWAEFVPFRRRRARGNHLSYQLAEQQPRTEVWHVISSHSGELLGVIRWHGPWRQYVICPADGTYWSAGCLQDVQARINNLMVKRRERR